MRFQWSLQRRAAWVARGKRCVMGARSNEGGALIEFAVALPLLMTVLTGAASFTMAFYSLQQLENAVSGAVQAIAAQQGTLSDPCETAQTLVEAAIPTWTTSKLSFSMNITNSGGTVDNYPSSGMTSGSSTFSCTAGSTTSSGLSPGEPVTLNVQYTYTWIPVLAFSPSSALTASETAMAD